MAGKKHSSLLGPFIIYEEKSFIKLGPGRGPEAGGTSHVWRKEQGEKFY